LRIGRRSREGSEDDDDGVDWRTTAGTVAAASTTA
jgi:hypothetical protein